MAMNEGEDAKGAPPLWVSLVVVVAAAAPLGLDAAADVGGGPAAPFASGLIAIALALSLVVARGGGEFPQNL
jgi:hypothetical protein